MKRQHKVAILKYTTKNFWLLLIPLVRGLIAVGFDLYNWFQGAYLDIIAISLMIGLAVLRWRFVQFQILEDGVAVKTGVLLRNEFTVPYRALSCVSSKRAMWFRPIKAVTVSIDSDSRSVANKRGGADIEIIMKIADYDELYQKAPNNSGAAKITYYASKYNLIFFSLVFSSTLSGVIFLGTLFIQGGRLVGGELERIFITAVTDVTSRVQTIINGVTPLTVALTLVIALGWGFSFFSNLLRHINFKAQRFGGSIIVENGFFSRWKYYVNSARINCADLRQNLLMKACKVMSVHVSCTGYGKSRNEIPVFVPVTTRNRVIGSMRLLLPDFTVSDITLKTKGSYILPFIWAPLLAAAAFPVGAVLAVRFFPGWGSVAKFLLIMGEIPSLYMLAVGFTAKFSTGIGIGESTVTLRYCRTNKFHTVIVPKDKIVYVRLSRTVFQLMNGTADVWVYTRGERAAKHRIRGIPAADAERFMGEYGN
ncbi:MAG: PH domain-containing protein [Ruminococcus sp.]|nr:PH domain-containing protein [Ruminococcus sp.]MCM1381113.1 PH domain-containing protein [Muribaculaceae bacterium]MCM1479965.1 PH domain-containing protein [Muribaculaceae bacterium]